MPYSKGFKSIEPPIIIAAVPKSGSSLVAGIFHAHGVWVGFHEVKRDGYDSFENPLLDQGTLSPEIDFQVHAERVVPRNTRWLYKCSVTRAQRALEHYPDAHVIKCHRDLYGIIRSNPESTWKKRIAQYDELHSMAGMWVDTDAVINRDFDTLRRAFRHCGIPFDPDLAKGCINDDLWHHRSYKQPGRG